MQYLNKANHNVPGDPVVLEHLGDAYHKAGKTGRAVELWKRALEADRENQILREKIVPVSP